MMTAREFRKIFAETRRRSEEICAHLQTEDFGVQPVEHVSPPKWHLGHTSWFFEELVLKKCPGYTVFDPRFGFIFNSYYESVGERVPRRERGNLSRPTVARVLAYRAAVTEATLGLLEDWSGLSPAQKSILEVGVHHEQQHQELLWTDIKYILGHNPLVPYYTESLGENPAPPSQGPKWVEVPAGIYEIGHADPERFCYDNERARHRVFLEDFTISTQLVQNQDYLAFIQDGGYADSLLWHAEGWQWRTQNEIDAPLYWQQIDGQWFQYTLGGLQKLQLDAPLSHISFYEAAAFARWKGMRLPTEFEWEAAQAKLDWGARWEWTESAYTPYPGFQKAPGALGEYNAKFMVNQKVLRGASVATPATHQRPTYRNYFHPPMRWQFTGIRLAN
ncbi:ergothioneine biosynthesis protein EgtB [Bradymonas sediminis]|uniref:Ergothioneine biosynthesis protein EgtB n=1 Tax=Bradymonas sediminis TaxID=1548548 RepID=A0A2Z4FR24_9DELT|nr:ergothioneine biosynthesis protein EgtB [Bradymonas sediminis]AWV91215.1 ergothioneine biosynthesis protein EgtB [Bradymonas sediminis]TDP73781.1 ergothioneine biosynthesis protein EgtB [Bradymonas sediminis]